MSDSKSRFVRRRATPRAATAPHPLHHAHAPRQVLSRTALPRSHAACRSARQHELLRRQAHQRLLALSFVTKGLPRGHDLASDCLRVSWPLACLWLWRRSRRAWLGRHLSDVTCLTSAVAVRRQEAHARGPRPWVRAAWEETGRVSGQRDPLLFLAGLPSETGPMHWHHAYSTNCGPR